MRQNGQDNFSENFAFCCSLFLIYHAASGPWILRHSVIAYFQGDKFNLWGILNSNNSPLTCWTSSVAQRNRKCFQSGQWVCVFSVRCSWSLSIFTIVRMKFTLFTKNLLVLKPQPCQSNQWHLKETHIPIVFDHSHNLLFSRDVSIKSHRWNSACLVN